MGTLGFITAAERAGPFPESRSNACTQSYICICGCTCWFWLGRNHSPELSPATVPAGSGSSLSALLLPAWLVFIAGNVASPVIFSPQTVCCCSVWSEHAVPQLGETIHEGENLEMLAFLHLQINFLFSGFPPRP